ncbi:MAG: YncE family protein [Bryobacterales bacterium]|nr:YncE family protein [Bryobacterales bacterium]MBV9401500.1 YncE family protein [Bryobacterales bacterium]
MKSAVLLLLCAAVVCAETPSPALVVLNKGDNAMAIVNPANGKVAGTVPVGRNPHEAAVSDDGKLAFSSNMQGNSISVIDLATLKEIHRVDLPNLRTPHGLFFADRKLYFTAQGDNSIARYDPATNQIDWKRDSGATGTHMLVMTKDLNKIFTSNMNSDNIGMFERAPGGQDYKLILIPVGKGPEAIDLSPDGKQIWTATGGDSHIAIIDAANGTLIETVHVPMQRANRLKFTPDGKKVLISDSGNGDLVIMDSASHKETKRLKIGGNCEGILIAPDGARAYVASEMDNFIGVIDLKKLELSGRIRPGNGPDGMAWAVRK